LGAVVGSGFPALSPDGGGKWRLVGGELGAELLELSLHFVLLAPHELIYERLSTNFVL
jgi:hypothetical protein